MLGRRYEIARLHSDFYRDQYRRLLRWVWINMLVAFVLLAVITYLILFRPVQHYYANTIEGKILPITIADT